jgi:hypothetical protein
MKTILFLFSLGAFVIVWNGCSCCTFKAGDSGGLHERSDQVSSPAAIKQNFSYIEAVVDSVKIIDDIRYEVNLLLSSVKPGNSHESIAESGQYVRVVPQYVEGGDNSPDMNNIRNKNLLSVRTAKSGSVLKGSISLSPSGKWVLIDVNK